MSTTTNLGFELVDVTEDTVPFSTKKYVNENFEALDAINPVGRLNALENATGNLRIGTGEYIGDGSLTRTSTFSRDRYIPSMIFIWPYDVVTGEPTTHIVLCLKCDFNNTSYTGVSIFTKFIMDTAGPTYTDPSTTTCTLGSTVSTVTWTCDDAERMMNKDGTSYRYFVIGRADSNEEVDA